MIDFITSGNATALATQFAGDWLAADSARRSNDDTNANNRDIARNNVAYQKEFAQSGVRWKVDDAVKAGLHPIYALGANTASFNPISIGHETDNSQANMYQSMGQNLGRAISATRTADERTAANLQIASLQADVEGKTIDNQIRLNQLQKLNTGVGPSFPSSRPTGHSPTGLPGQGDATKILPSESISSHKGRPAMQAGAINDYGFVKTDTGFAIVPSKDVKERIEDNVFMEGAHALRNLAMPNVGGGPPPPPKEWLPQGFDYWRWNHGYQEYQPQMSNAPSGNLRNKSKHKSYRFSGF